MLYNKGGNALTEQAAYTAFESGFFIKPRGAVVVDGVGIGADTLFARYTVYRIKKLGRVDIYACNTLKAVGTNKAVAF